MADKGFGIRQLNLIGASGTPKIESPNNLNLNAVTVAISTDVTIGGQVTSNIIVGTGKSVGIGTTNPVGSLQVGAGTSAFVVTSNGKVGIGTNTPSTLLHIQSTDPTFRFKRSDASTNAYGELTTDTSGLITLKSDPGGAAASSGFIFTVDNTERVRIDSDGNFSYNQTPGRYSVDVTPGATSIANGGTVDFQSASGMLVVNNHTNGNVTIYICGGGTVTAVANTGSNVGSFAYNSGINGYRWTNNSGSTATVGFFFVRTRAYS